MDDDTINIQIINNIHKELSASISTLLNKSKFSPKTKRNKNIYKYKNYHTNKDKLSNNKKAVNGKNNIKSRNNTFINSYGLNNNIKLQESSYRNNTNNIFCKNNYYTNKEKSSNKKKDDKINKAFSNIKYIFDNYNFHNNSLILNKHNNPPKSATKNNKLNLNKKNIGKENYQTNIKKNNNNNSKLKADKSKSKDNNNTTKIIKLNSNKTKIINDKNLKIQNSKESTSMSSFNTFKIIKDSNKICNNKTIKSKNKKLRTSKNNILIKSNSNLNISKTQNEKKNDMNSKDKTPLNISQNEKKNNPISKDSKIIKVTPYTTENKKINLLSKIEIDSISGLVDLDIHNENQDSLFIFTNNPFLTIYKNKNNNCNLFIENKSIDNKNKVITMENSYSILGICDGYGEQGRTISNYISSIIPDKINKFLKTFSNKINKENTENEIKQYLTSTFYSVNKKLNSMQSLDTSYSGTCFCSLIIDSSSIISINLGNSLAVIGKEKIEGEKKIFESYNITYEHTPLLEKEKERIIEKGGEISKEKDEFGREFGPLKIWGKTDLFQGLMNTRGFGYKEANLIGLISEPEIQYFEMIEEYKFIIIGSYGFWNFINTNECVEIVGKYYLENDINMAINKIMELSKSRWIEERGEIMEDISVILSFFHLYNK